MSFYAYVHVRPGADAHGVFYVGKGHGRRSHEFSRRNRYHQRVIDKHGAGNVEVGRKMRDEARANMSAAQKLVQRPPHSAETRAKLSVAIKESWRRRKQLDGDNQ